MVETMERQVLGRISASNGCTTIRPPWRCYGLLDENLTLITYGYCWSTPKRRKSCLGHAFVEGPKSLESNAVTAAVSRGKRMTNQYPAGSRKGAHASC